VKLSIGTFVKSRRADLGLSLEDVARLAGCTKSHVWDIEQGKASNPTVKTALALCAALRCSLSNLLGIDATQPVLTDDELELVVAYRAIRKRSPA
jgi:transcriptional regulator with XRE-family HTH domain